MVLITEILEKYRLSDVKAIAANGNTILHLVVEDEDFTAQEKIEILTMLLDNGLDPNSKNHKDETVLHLAIKIGARDIIDILLQSNVHLDNLAALYFIENEYNKLLELKNQSDDEMLMEESESVSFLEWMIARGLDIDCPNDYGRSALFLAIGYNLYHLLPVMLKCTKNIHNIGYETRRTLLHIVLGNKAQTRWPPTYSRRYASDVLNILLDRGVSPQSVDSTLNTALHLAIADCTDMNVVQKLIDHTTNFNNKNDAGETPFLIAIREYLKWEKPSIDKHWKIPQSLITKGAEVDEENKLGLRPLHIFAEETSSCECLDEEEIKLFEMLISIGCKVNAKNLRGETPLHLAAAGRNVTVVKKMIENGAHVNSRDDDGATPLHFMSLCKENSAEIARVLIEHGANVNAKDCKGFTPLMKAAGEQVQYSDDCDGLKILLEHGADFCALTDEGYSVLDVAVAKFNNCYLFDTEGVDNGICKKLSLRDVSESSFFNYSYKLSEEIEFLLMHWIKLYAAELECDVGDNFDANDIGNQDGLMYYPDSKKIHKNCKKEVEILKNTFIDDNRTSIYAFIHMNVNSRRAHVHNEELDKLVHSPAQLEKQFPQYATLILSSYNETIRRKSLTESAKKAWMKLTKTHLGDLCIEHILSFLHNIEFYDLIEASEIDHCR